MSKPSARQKGQGCVSMLGSGGWAARRGRICGFGVKLQTGGLLFPHLLGSVAAREKGDRLPSGSDSVHPRWLPGSDWRSGH